MNFAKFCRVYSFYETAELTKNNFEVEKVFPNNEMFDSEILKI